MLVSNFSFCLNKFICFLHAVLSYVHAYMHAFYNKSTKLVWITYHHHFIMSMASCMHLGWLSESCFSSISTTSAGLGYRVFAWPRLNTSQIMSFQKTSTLTWSIYKLSSIIDEMSSDDNWPCMYCTKKRIETLHNHRTPLNTTWRIHICNVWSPNKFFVHSET